MGKPPGMFSRRPAGAAPWHLAGLFCAAVTVFVVTGWRLAGERAAGLGPAAACLVLAASLLARAWGTSGRVRPRLLLMASSAAAGCVYRAGINLLPAERLAAGAGGRPLSGTLVATGLTVAVGLGLAGIVVAADAGTGQYVWLRRVLDGAVTSGAVFMTGWVLLLRGSDSGWRLRTGLYGVIWTAEAVCLGFLLAYSHCVRTSERTTVWVAFAGMALALTGDTLHLWASEPDLARTPPSWIAGACGTTGLSLIAACPWMPGGATLLGAPRPAWHSGMEGAAAFVPLAACTVMALGYALAPLRHDPVLLAAGAAVLLGCWARQTFLPSERRTGHGPHADDE